MSWRNAFDWLTGGTPKEEEGAATIQQQLKALGFSVVTDDKLRQRIAALREFHDSIEKLAQPEGENPRERVESIKRHMQFVNQQLGEIAIPWGRGGSEASYNEAMWGWTGIHAMSLDFVDSILHLIETPGTELPQAADPENPGLHRPAGGAQSPERQQEELYQKLQHFVTSFYIRYAQLILTISWRKEDVAPSWIANVQYPFMPEGSPRIIEQGGPSPAFREMYRRGLPAGRPGNQESGQAGER
jgi:hypothetical protein